MIVEPKIGMRVKWIGANSCRKGRSGIIVAIPFPHDVDVDFGMEIGWGLRIWACNLNDLQQIELTPEELDAQRRKDFAEKYL